MQLSLLGVKISQVSKKEVFGFVQKNLKAKKKFFITTPNPEIVVEANRNKKLLEALDSSDLALADGQGLVLAARFLQNQKLKRVRGRDIFDSLLALASKKGWRVYLLGSTQETINRLTETLAKNHQNLKVKLNCGPWLDDKGNPLTPAEEVVEKGVLKEINTFSPNLLFVGFGAPKQEFWVNKFFTKIKIGGVMVVGGSFDYLAGTAKLPPSWVANLGFEWLWRLILEPQRAGRIFKAVIVFPLLVIKEKLKSF